MSSSEKKSEGEKQQQGGLLPEGEYPPPPPLPQQQQQQQQPPQFAPPPTSEQLPYFPPPPPGPPPHQEEQHHGDSAPPPSYEQGNFVPPASEKQPIPPPPPAQQATQQGEFPASGSEKQFPPPPPGPPPVQTHPDPLSANPVDTSAAVHQSTDPAQQQRQQYQEQQQQQQQTYTIPQYNPAAPIFAPPPTQPADPTYAPEVPVPEGSTPIPAAVSGTTSTEQHQPHKKHGWSERFSSLGIKAAAPINSLAHKLGSQSFLPESLDKECEKAASILKTFCKKGVYADPGSGQPPTSTDPKATATNDAIIDPTKQKPKSRVIVTIPPKVISKAVGLAIFTTLRAGFNVSGATGSGILIARLPDGSWGPPSGIQVHSVGGGFSIGLDIYDCVCVINSREALAAFTNTRVGLGTDLAVVAGPYGAGGAVEFGAAMENRPGRKQGEKETTSSGEQTLKPEQAEGSSGSSSKRRSLSASAFKPVFSYVKSRGFYAGIQIDGTVVVERKDANAVFYGERVPVDKILKGEVPAQGPSGMWPAGARGLLETLKGAEAGMTRDDHQQQQHQREGKETEKGTTATDTPPVTAAATGARPSTGTEHPPAYVDDGVHRPEVGDHKYR